MEARLSQRMQVHSCQRRAGMMHAMNGMPITTSLLMTEPAEDWSRVRSPSRATRRLKQGHRQNIRHWQKPSSKIMNIGGTLHMHPEMLRELKRAAGDAGATMPSSRFGGM